MAIVIMLPEQTLISAGQNVIDIEAEAVQTLKTRIDHHFVDACKIILKTKGKVIVTGMGKSGHIGNKIAATLASTGTPAFFVHPAEARHGDLGMISGEDIVIGISNSGNTEEVVSILPLIKRMGTKLISMTGDANSLLAEQSDCHLDVSVAKEACSLGLAPTASTTATLVMGDALAVALLEARGFTPEEFALSHPGGALGRKLFTRATELMHGGEQLPLVRPETLVLDALLEITQKGLGMTTVVDSDDMLVGIYTDGDLRRTLNAGLDVRSTQINEVMSLNPTRISEHTLASQAAKIMQDKRINGLIIIDSKGSPLGALNMQDLLRAGIV